MDASVTKSIPDIAALVAHVWRRSYNRNGATLLAFTARSCALFTFGIGRDGSDSHTLRDCRSIGDGDDDVALLVSLFDVPVGFGDALQRVSPVDHRLQLPRFGELPEPDEIVAANAR